MSTASRAAPPPLPQGLTVLHIGDSFAGALGLELNQRLEARGIRGVLRYETATYITTWAWHEDLAQWMRELRPDLILVTLGANEIEIRQPEQRSSAIQRLVRQFQGRACVWVAPPLWAPDTGLMRVVREHARPCRFLDTTAQYPNMQRTSDGVHPTMPARAVWADIVLEWLARERDPAVNKTWAWR